MASPFQRYQSGIEASTGNLVQAYGQMGQQTAQAIAGFGQNLAQGIQQYNENSAKNEILTSEAETLGMQIQQFKDQFGDSPEHAPFAQSLQPYIEQLSKVPSMSLTQKMGAVTGVKAAFANIGQQLQAFEVMRGERLKRDYWAARNQTPSTNVVTDPVAIAKGEVPWDDTKTYDQNIAGFRAVAQKAVDNGVAIDIEKASGLYVANIKQALKTGRDKQGRPIAPENLAALQDQIAKGESFEQDLLNAYLGEDEESSFNSLMNLGDTIKSAKDKVNEKKASSTTPTTSEIPILESLDQQRASAQSAIEALKNGSKPPPPKPKEFTYKEIESMAKSEKANVYHFLGKFNQVQTYDGRTVYIDKKEAPPLKDLTKREPKPTGDIAKYISAYESRIREIDKEVDRIGVQKRAKDELTKIDSLIAEADQASQRGEDVPRGYWAKLNDSLRPMMDEANLTALKSYAKLQINQGKFDSITPDNARRLLRDTIRGGDTGTLAMYGSLITPDPAAFDISAGFGFAGSSARELKKNEIQAIENAFKEWSSDDVLKKAIESKDSDYIKTILTNRKSLLEGQAATGQSAPTPTQISKANAEKAKKEEVEKPTLIGTSSNLVIGTKRREVKASVEQQESAMAGFFQKKYGYVPAGFSDMFRANTPEANFKTMETPYGAFMWDGKGWSQIKTGTPMSAKEMGENAAYQFSNSDGSPKEFANSGVYLSGTFQGTTTELAKFRTEYRSLAHAERSIARLIEINEMTGESLSPTLKGEAKALLPAIKAALRTEIIGVGTVSNYEQELINDVVAGAADFWSLEASDRAKLAVIMDRVRNSINDVPAIYGLSVQRKGDSANIEKSLRQALLSSGGISSREAKWRAANPDKQ